jgi:ribosomal protein L18E
MAKEASKSAIEKVKKAGGEIIASKKSGTKNGSDAE